MPLHKLYNLSTGSGNPSYLTGVLPGGAGSATAGTSTNPMISAPRLEESVIEVLDASAQSLIGTNTQGLPAPVGKLLVMDNLAGAFGGVWALSKTSKQAIPRGQYGIVVSAGQASETTTPVSTPFGNRSIPGTKAVVMYDGPVQAFVTTTVDTTAISAGMPLAADGAGNLQYAGASPNAGTVLARAAGNVPTATSTPALINVYLGGY